ncbi:MAG: helicase-related protein, partial [Dehalococcoidales bacterium]|nr:helicase-related protein [Dehalococcoidales bacterium]
CLACGGPLWQADRTGPRRFPLADYIRHRMAGYFDLLIVDEGHEYKARGSAQGLAAGALAAVCGKALTLTGTIFGGYSSTLFYLLWRFSPAARLEFGYREEAKWVGRYGIIERITTKDPDAYTDDGRHSKRRGYLTRTAEKPGVSPAVLFHLIGNTVFLRLADVAQNLPTYTERVALFPLEAGRGGEEPSQASCYRRLASDLWQAVAAALQQGSKRLLAAYLQALLAYPDACTKGETVVDHVTGSVIAHAPALPTEVLYPKERALVDLVRRERTRGRCVLVFITHTESRDISPRLRLILEREGFRVAVLKAGTVSADRREEWVAARVREGADVLICHPRLVQTGLDLVDWPSVVWFEPEYSVYVLRQASRRSWRIGQRQPVEVTYLVYEGTLQAEALALVAAKMRSSLMIEGELPEDGLAALEGGEQDVFLSLARRLTEQGSGEERSLEALFAQTQAIEAEAEDYLVDGEWEIPARPMPPIPERFLPEGDAADLWQRVFNGETPAEPCIAHGPTPGANGRMMSFEELAHRVRRPKPRRKPVPEGQIALFDD